MRANPPRQSSSGRLRRGTITHAHRSSSPDASRQQPYGKHAELQTRLLDEKMREVSRLSLKNATLEVRTLCVLFGGNAGRYFVDDWLAGGSV
jgi:hypothetical protein